MNLAERWKAPADLTVVLLLLLAGGALTGCASHQGPPAPPLTVDGGHGSEYGNYGMTESNQTVMRNGETCVVWLWDRPVSATQALRVRSASCPSPEKSGGMVATELDRTLIPLSQSRIDRSAAAP